MPNVTFTANGGLRPTQAIGNALRKAPAGTLPNLSKTVSNNALSTAASAGRIWAPNGLRTVNGGEYTKGAGAGTQWNAAGSSARAGIPDTLYGQQWGTFGPAGPDGGSQARVNALIAQNAARTTSGSQGGGATGFTGGTTMGGNSQLPGMGGAGMGAPAFGGMQSMGGFGGPYMGQLGDMIAGGQQQPPPAAPPPKPKPEPGTGPGWVDPRDPLTFTGGGYPADDTTHGNALIQQMLASNPRMPQRGDPSGKPGPKPPTVPKGKGGKPGWGGHGGGHHGGPWWR